MKKLIHKFLSNDYSIIKFRGGSYRIVNNRTGESEYLSGLLNEIIEVFDISKKRCKWYLKSWTQKECKAFDFNEYYKKDGYYLVYAPYIPRNDGLHYVGGIDIGRRGDTSAFMTFTKNRYGHNPCGKIVMEYNSRTLQQHMDEMSLSREEPVRYIRGVLAGKIRVH